MSAVFSYLKELMQVSAHMKEIFVCLFVVEEA